MQSLFEFPLMGQDYSFGRRLLRGMDVEGRLQIGDLSPDLAHLYRGLIYDGLDFDQLRVRPFDQGPERQVNTSYGHATIRLGPAPDPLRNHRSFLRNCTFRTLHYESPLPDALVKEILDLLDVTQLDRVYLSIRALDGPLNYDFWTNLKYEKLHSVSAVHVFAVDVDIQFAINFLYEFPFSRLMLVFTQDNDGGIQAIEYVKNHADSDRIASVNRLTVVYRSTMYSWDNDETQWITAECGFFDDV